MILTDSTTLKPSLGEALGSGYLAHPRYRGCRAHWLITEGSGLTVRDISGKSNAGTRNTTTGVTWVPARHGRALRFDGVSGSYVNIPNNGSLNFVPTNFTFSAWVAHDNSGSTDKQMFDTQGVLVLGTSSNRLKLTKPAVADYLGTTTMTRGVWYHIAHVKKGDSGTNLIQYLNAKPDGAHAVSSIATLGTFSKQLGETGGNPWVGWLSDVRVYDRALTPGEIMSLYRDPFLEFTRPTQVYFFFGGANAYTLDCEPGSYGLTGISMTPLAARMINAAPGTYATTGLAMTLARGLFLNAETGVYSITGSSTTLLANRVINAAPGAYDITGSNAGIVAGRVINAAPGVYLVTGADGSFLADRMLNAETGSLLVTGANTAVLVDRVLKADPGAIVITGADATLVLTSLAVAYELSCEPGVYAVTGFNTGLIYTQLIIDGVPTGIPNVLADGSGRLLVTETITGLAVPTGIPGVLADSSTGSLLVTFSPIAPLHSCGIPNVLRDSTGAILVTTSPTGNLRPTGIPGVFADQTGAIYVEQVSSTADVGTGIPNVYATADQRLRVN